MTRTGNVLAAGGKGHGGGGLGNEISRPRPQDVNSENAIALGIGQHFHFAFGLAQGLGAAIGAEGKDPASIVCSLSLEILLSFADGRYLRMGVHHVRNRMIIDMAIACDHAFHTSNPFFLSFMGQHRTTDDIADRIDACGGRRVVFIDGDVTFFVGLNAQRFKIQPVRTWQAADGDQDAVAKRGLFPFTLDHTAVSFYANLHDAALQLELQPLLFEKLHRVSRQVAVHLRQNAVHQLQGR